MQHHYLNILTGVIAVLQAEVKAVIPSIMETFRKSYDYIRKHAVETLIGLGMESQWHMLEI